MFPLTNRFFHIFLIILIPACRQAGIDESENSKSTSNNIIIEGILDNGAGKTIYIERMGAKEFFPIDTVICSDKGSFKFVFQTDQTTFYALRCFEQGYVTLLLEPGEVVKFTGNFHSTNPYQVCGSKGSSLIRELADVHKKTIDSMAYISRKNRESINNPDYQSIKPELDRKFDSLASGFYDYSLRFIHDHPESLSILIALYNQYGYGLPVFNLKSDMNVFRFVDSTLSLHYPDNDAVKMLHAQIISSGQAVKELSQTKGPGMGDKAPDFVLNNPNGDPVTLSEFRGKYVLLSFWAAWSKPAKAENEILKNAYDMYGEKGFEILQISLDDNKSLWINTIKSDSLLWNHASDLKRWESKVNDLYAIEKIPSNFLISPDGTIMETNLFGKALTDELATIFK